LYIIKLIEQEMHRFLHALKSLVRGRNAVAMVTLPPSLVRTLDEASVKRFSWAVDACLEIKGFAGTSIFSFALLLFSPLAPHTCFTVK
jgi:hypothetical protein